MSPTLPFSSASGDDPSDLLLVRAALAGEEQAVSAFIRRMRCVPRILTSQNRKLRTYLNSEELADVVQDTLEVIWRRLPAFSGNSSLEHWSYTICTYSLMNAVRSKKRRRREGSQELLAQHAAKETPEVPALEHEAVHAALKRIPPSHARVIQLKTFGGMSFSEIAQNLGITQATAKGLYYTGLRILGTLLRSFETRELP